MARPREPHLDVGKALDRFFHRSLRLPVNRAVDNPGPRTAHKARFQFHMEDVATRFHYGEFTLRMQYQGAEGRCEEMADPEGSCRTTIAVTLSTPPRSSASAISASQAAWASWAFTWLKISRSVTCSVSPSLHSTNASLALRTPSTISSSSVSPTPIARVMTCLPAHDQVSSTLSAPAPTSSCSAVWSRDNGRISPARSR